jgi:hypothetical protein
LAVAAGLPGVLVLIDEVESVCTKLPTILSRFGAYDVLDQLCFSSAFEGVRMICANTPDAQRVMAAETGLMLRRGRLGGPMFESAFELRAMGHRDRDRLLEKVYCLYQKAYPSAEIPSRGSEEWRELRKLSESEELPVRLLVRTAIDFLDTANFTAE